MKPGKLNSVIFAGLSLSNRPGTTDIDLRIVYAASAFGIILSVLWFLTALRSEVYYRYWISQVRNVESQMKSSIPVFQDLHLAHHGNTVAIGKETFGFNRMERRASIGAISRFVAISFLVIWILLAIAFSL